MELSKAQFGEFSIRGLRSLEKWLNEDPSLFEKEWREIARQTFGMTPNQNEFLDGCPLTVQQQLQDQFQQAAKHIRNGGQVRLKIVMENESTRALYLMTVTKQGDGADSVTAAASIPIICCDAYCGDWHWC